MIRILLLSTLLAASCVRPEVEIPKAGAVHVLGATLEIAASWQRSCIDWSATIDNLRAKGHQASEDKPCHEKPFALEITCSTPCAPPHGVSGVGTATADVVATQLGPLTITVTQRRLDNGATSTKVMPQVQIVLPDRLELRCQAPDKLNETAPCGPDGVLASAPLIEPVIHLGDRTETSSALRANGMRLEPGARQVVSLAQLFPEARVGDGVRPGIYTVRVSVGTVADTWQVVAR